MSDAGLSTVQVARAIGAPYSRHGTSRVVDHGAAVYWGRRAGSGRRRRYSGQEALALGIARVLRGGDRGAGSWESVAEPAFAAAHAWCGDVEPAYLVLHPRGYDVILAGPDADRDAFALVLAHRWARVVRCRPLIEAIEAEDR